MTEGHGDESLTIVLMSLRRFLRGESDGEAFVSMESWVTSFVYYSVFGKYPLHIFPFLSQSPDTFQIRKEERQEIAAFITDAFFREKIGREEMLKIVQVVSTDKGLKYYLISSCLNWVRDKIRIAARYDDSMHLGIKIEKLLRKNPDIYTELIKSHNWRESMWAMMGVETTSKTEKDAVNVYIERTADIDSYEPKISGESKYRPRLISTADLSALIREIFIVILEHITVFELLEVTKTKVPVREAAKIPESLDAKSRNTDETLIDTVEDSSLSAEIFADEYDIENCAKEFLDGLDDIDARILYEILNAVFQDSSRAETEISKEIPEKSGVPTSTYYYRKERLKLGLSAVLANQDELAFYKEIHKQLESGTNIAFK